MWLSPYNWLGAEEVPVKWPGAEEVPEVRAGKCQSGLSQTV